MSTSSKQLTQVKNICNTLLELTEHFHQLIKKREFHQSIFILSSIVEGFNAIGNHLNKIDSKVFSETEKYILEITRLLEKQQFLKISEILQFTFIPHQKKILRLVNEQFKPEYKEKVCSIGVFSSFANPKDFYPEPRIKAMVQESIKQNAQLLFFTSKDVNFEKEEISADVYIDGEWKRVIAPFPDVINNIGAGKRSHVERKLRRKIPFTSFHVGNKLTLPMRMAKYKKYMDLLVPFQLCRNVEQILHFVEQNNKVVFKYLLSNRGENIYFVTKKGTRYILQEHKKERILNEKDFNIWLQEIILRKKMSFIVQKYIHTRTKNNEPYHFRAHVQKNGKGEWVLTHIYPRVGNRKSNLSNVATDGFVDDFHDFMQEEFGEKGRYHEENILRLSLEIAQHLDKLYGFALDELGIDLAIDENGKYWMHEANNGPQTAYHEEKRALNTIAYAKYIAENGIFYTETVKKSQTGMFQAKLSKVPFAELDDKLTIGILAGKIIEKDLLNTALTKLAKKENMECFLFTPNDVDYDEMLIKGYLYVNDEWTPRIVEYPDIILDRLKRRGNADYQWIYEELEHTPFINEWSSTKYKRSNIYHILASKEEIAPFQRVARTRDVFHFIEKYNTVLLKPESYNSASTFYIERITNTKYLVLKNNKITEYNQLQLINHLKEIIETKNYIVQANYGNIKNNEQIHRIIVHQLFKTEDEWDFVNLYTEIIKVQDDNKLKNETEHLSKFLRNYYKEHSSEELEQAIKEHSRNIANKLSKVYRNEISEVYLEYIINDEKQIIPVEVNPNGPSKIFDTKNYAESIITYAKYLGTTYKNQNQ